jgi:hypothetical protein
LPINVKENSFNTVIATDVLEHLENHIEVLEDMIRITDKHIILSLPNGWAMMKSKLFNKNSDSGKFYGFPIDKSEDRHKWFFNAVEAEDFYKQVAKKYNLEVVELFHVGYYHESNIKELIRFFTKKIFGNEVRKNIFSIAVWCALEKKS